MKGVALNEVRRCVAFNPQVSRQEILRFLFAKGMMVPHAKLTRMIREVHAELTRENSKTFKLRTLHLQSPGAVV